jgi:hypothetical protein
MGNPLASAADLSVNIASINQDLLSSKRVFPIEPSAKRSIGTRKTTITLEKNVGLAPGSFEAPKNSVRYASRKEPVLSISNVREKDPVQKRRLDELLLSHVETLTRQGSSSHLLLPKIAGSRH